MLRYLEGWRAIEQANAVFGHDGWGAEVVGEVAYRPLPSRGATATLPPASTRRPCGSPPGRQPHSDVGTTVARNQATEEHATTSKAATTDALKRALRHFGARFGNGLGAEVAALDERIAVLFEEAGAEAILTSAPGIGPVTGPQILARLGDPSRFRSLAGVRSFSGLVPSLNASGVSGRHGRSTRRGDAALREAIFIAADHARRIDPTLAARYQRLMVLAGKHHNSALCHVATALLTRVVACWRRGEHYVIRDCDGEHYVIRDCDGQPVSVAEGRSIVAERYSVPAKVRRQRLGSRVSTRKGTGRRGQESHSAPAPARPLPALQPLVGA